MKQYTKTDQTAKLIELGFERPKFEIETQLCNIQGQPIRAATIIGDYSIGELIEMLPQIIEFGENGLLYPLRVMPTVGGGWAISYCNEYDERNNELIDAIYDMIVKLKAEGVI